VTRDVLQLSRGQVLLPELHKVNASPSRLSDSRQQTPALFRASARKLPTVAYVVEQHTSS
jgi:hypothetical protein